MNKNAQLNKQRQRSGMKKKHRKKFIKLVYKGFSLQKVNRNNINKKMGAIWRKEGDNRNYVSFICCAIIK